MASPEQVAFAVLTLPNEQLVMQRRREHTHFGNCLGFYGGAVEGQEQPLEALHRELKEETSLDPDNLKLVHIDRFVLEVSPRRVLEFFAFLGRVTSRTFRDTDGGFPETHSLDELHERSDLTPGSKVMVGRLIKRSEQWL